jgi:hypothetical protein
VLLFFLQLRIQAIVKPLKKHLRNECLHSKSVNSDMKYYIVHNIAQNLFMREINVFSVVLQLLVCVIAKKKEARTVSVNCNIFFLKSF